ncbi:MAG: serine hydrolase [Hominisplanchenecus sp.]|nr:serine hydrolase [Hominisplanchenecus sp.]
MTCKKLKKPLVAALLSGSLLLQGFPVFAGLSDTESWLSQSPFSAQKETENTESETSETESETDAPDSDEALHSGNPLEVKVLSDEFREMLRAATLTPKYSFDIMSLDLSWEQLESELTHRINRYSSKWSLYLKDLSTGNVISINERPQESASLIKLYVMGAVMQQIQDNELEMTDTILKLLNEMITVSDNSATNELVRYLDPDHNHRNGMEKVNEFIETQGFTNTHEYNGLEDSSLWYSLDTPNTTSTRDCGVLLERIYNGEFVSHLASRQMEDLLLDQEVTYKIPSTIPSESTVANKTGETSDCENDAAIVYTPKGDYILCIMSCGLTSKNSAVTYLREMSSLIYNYFMNRGDSQEPSETSEIATDTREESEAETESETGEKKHYENLGKDLEK